jgi:lysophospholipase L1-like esterase
LVETDEHHSHTRVLSRGRKAALTLVCTVAMLCLSEAAVRLRAWVRYGTAQPDSADQMFVLDSATGMSIPRPGYERHSGRVSIRINSLGFRGRDITVAKPPGTIRIATLGASTTFCAEVSNDDATWPQQLEQALQRAHPDLAIQVINAGVPGYIAADSLKNLQRRVLPLDPDLVIYYEANNDLAHDTRRLARERGLAAGSESALARTLAHYSLLFDLIRKNSRILLAGHSAVMGKLQDLPANLPDRFVADLAALHRELRAHDIPMVMSTFFMKYRRDQPPDVQSRNAAVVFFYMPWMTMDGLLRGIDLYNDAIVNYAHAHGVPVIDDRDSIPGDDRHFADWTHFADAGAAAMGQRVARFLEQEGLLRAAIANATRRSAVAGDTH